MPSNYAHYRFGVAALAAIPKEARKPISRFRRLYDVGLHGPDLFFYYNPLMSTRVGRLGASFHGQTGQEFFTRICRGLRLEPTEAGIAYLCGALGHYCLDSACHPFINRMVEECPATHVQIETEFDRFLLEKDGKLPPHTQAIVKHLRLTPGECATVAQCYPGAAAGNIRRCVNNMAFCGKLLAAPEGPRRDALKAALGRMGEAAGGMLMTAAPDPQCSHLDGELLALYDQALARYPMLLAQVQDLLRKSIPLGEDFHSNFG